MQFKIANTGGFSVQICDNSTFADPTHSSPDSSSFRLTATVFNPKFSQNWNLLI